MDKVQVLPKDYEIDPNTVVSSNEFDEKNMEARAVVREKKSFEDRRHPSVTKKSIGFPGGFYAYLQGSGMQNLATYQALNYFANVSVLYDAVVDIVEPAKKIRSVWYNPKKKDWITEHESLELLENPGGGMSGDLFKEFWLTNFLVANNAFVTATGDVRKPPLELLYAYGQDMQLISDNKGYLNEIKQTQQGSTALSYFRDNLARDNTFRYYTKELEQELLVTRTFNVRFGMNNQWGMSRLKPIMFELEQFISQNMHNDSLLKRGASPSLLFSAEGELSKTQYSRLNDMIIDYYSGPMNAGKPILGENNMKVSNLSQSNKDMDFKEMLASLKARIYNIFNIPLPSVMPQQMTLANLESSRLMKYDDAILPAQESFDSQMTVLLRPRWKDLNGYVLTYNPDEIEALEPRRLANAQIVNGLQLLSTNEQRSTYLQREEVGPAGDDILIDSSKVPLARDKVVDDNDAASPRAAQKPEPGQTEPEGNDGGTLDEDDPIREDDVEKFIVSITRSTGMSKEEAFQKAVEHEMFKEDGIQNLDRFNYVLGKVFNKSEVEALAMAVSMGMFSDIEEELGESL